MATLAVYNLKAEKTGTINVPDEFFAAPVSHRLLHTVVNVLLGNAREPWAHTKDRSERRGGGKKPWAQKHTGNARHGSIRSPLWRKGGVTFGPRNERNYDQKVNRKVKQRAFIQTLSSKVHDGQLLVLEDSPLTKPSTKTFRAFFEQCVGEKTVLVVTGNVEPHIYRSVRNLPRVSVTHVQVVNVVDLLTSNILVLTKEAVEMLENRLRSSAPVSVVEQSSRT